MLNRDNNLQPIITTANELRSLVNLLSREAQIGIDTEFYWRKSYYPRLCLIQLATDRQSYLIDPLAPQMDLGPLATLLQARHIVKVLHAGSADLKILHPICQGPIAPLFDTQLAAAFLGLFHQGSLQQLLETLQIASLNKAATMTDWRRRPLTSEQITYARDDVRYLVTCYRILIRQLQQHCKLGWLEEDLHSLAMHPDTYGYQTPEQAFRRIKGYGKLNARSKLLLRKLSLWREQLAQQRDQAPQWLLSNASLLGIAAAWPQNPAKLKACLSEKDQRKQQYFSTLQTLISKARHEPPPPQDKPRSPPPFDEKYFKLIRAELHRLCTEQSIIPQIVASKEQLKRFLDPAQSSPLQSGWRYHHFGRHLENFPAD